MGRLLIVSPNFPPVNAPDMHRVRMSLPHFEASGWQPFVLALSPEEQAFGIEPALAQSLPDVPVSRVAALPLRITRPLGIGNAGLRAMGHLYRAGADLIRRESIDLVYFSTTMFPVMSLGRLWKQRFGVPYVLDMQDPWVSDYAPSPDAPPALKRRLVNALHRVLEPFTMRRVDGLVAVSEAYNVTLRERYPWITSDMCVTLPFGVNESDFDVARSLPWRNTTFDPADGHLHGVSVGRGGDDLRIAASILFRALQRVSASNPASQPVHLSFVGTDYAPVALQRRTIEPVAIAEGLGPSVCEHPSRVPYFAGLRLMLDADFLVLLGSDDRQYSPSKIYPYLAARRPIVAVLHENSPVADLITASGAGVVVKYASALDTDRAVNTLAAACADLFFRLPIDLSGEVRALRSLTAPHLTHRQCELFDAVLRRRASPTELPCHESQ